jgi:hypothetical protein
MKVIVAVGLMAVVIGAMLSCAAPANAQSATPLIQRAAPLSSDLSAQRRIRRRGTPIYIYGRSGYLPPTAVRACNAWYEQEYRPSGTVIVPRMRCHWING